MPYSQQLHLFTCLTVNTFIYLHVLIISFTTFCPKVKRETFGLHLAKKCCCAGMHSLRFNVPPCLPLACFYTRNAYLKIKGRIELAKSSIVMGSYYIIFCKDDIKYRDIKDHCFDSWGKITKHV